MNTILEACLFVIMFGAIVFLFFSFFKACDNIEKEISDSELKMNDQLNEVKTKIAETKTVAKTSKAKTTVKSEAKLAKTKEPKESPVVEETK